MNPRYERVYTNTITTNGELYITDPTFTSFTYPKLKLTVLPGEPHSHTLNLNSLCYQENTL